MAQKFKLKLIMFDLDGTLLHTAPEIAAAANQMLADLNRPTLPLAQVQSYIGEGAHALIKRCLTGKIGAEPDPILYQAAEPLFFNRYAQNAAQSQPFEGVLAGLQAVQTMGFALACVTNKPDAFTTPLLAQSGLADFFTLVVAGDTLPNKKPDPIQLNHICRTLGIPQTQAMLVGDSTTDIAAARAAGCLVVTVPYGYNQGKPIDAAQVDGTIKDLTELAFMVEKIN